MEYQVTLNEGGVVFHYWGVKTPRKKTQRNGADLQKRLTAKSRVQGEVTVWEKGRGFKSINLSGSSRCAEAKCRVDRARVDRARELRLNLP